MKMYIFSLFQLFTLSGTLRLFVDVFYLKVYFSYNVNYQMISDSSYVGTTACAQPYISTDLGLTF
jgi:hypothetical protein